MALTLTWVEFHGSDTPGTSNGEAATNINLGNADTVNITPSDSPIQAGDFSYFKQGKFNFSGSMTQIDNVRVYKSSGVYKTDELMDFSGSITASTPDITDQTWAAIPTSLPAWNVVLSGAALGGKLLQADSESSPGYTSGSRTHLVGFQLETTGSTEAGAVNQKVISVVYDTL